MPKGSDEERAAQSAALQAALVDACEVPLEIMATSVQVIESCVFMARHGSVLALSDAGAAAVLAKAALQAASLTWSSTSAPWTTPNAPRATATRWKTFLLPVAPWPTKCTPMS